MKKAGKILRIGLVAFVLVLAAGITFTIGWRPFIGPRKRAVTNRQFERTPERLARGRYLTMGLLGCENCHSLKDWTKHGAPMVPGTEFAGQSLEGLIIGFPGSPTVPNLTPDRETGGGDWTDDELARAIREGIKHDGTALFPMMPYSEYKALSDEDLACGAPFSAPDASGFSGEVPGAQRARAGHGAGVWSQPVGPAGDREVPCKPRVWLP
jgi:hypothetical protein